MVGKPEQNNTQATKDKAGMEEKKNDRKTKEDSRSANNSQEQGGPPERERGHFGGGRDRRGDHGGERGARRGGYHNRGDRDNQGGGGGPRNRGDRNQYQANEPTVSLEEALPPADKKFTGRCRLFVGNLPTDTSEEDFKKLFEKHGEFTEVFLNPSRGFGFIRMDFKKNAEEAKQELDGFQVKGRTLRVRFATHGAALKVKYLPQHVSNELLAQAFSIFGELERAVIIVDDRGKPTGEGIVEFARKPGAQAALKRISEGVFMLGSSPRPITVEPLEQKDDEDGYPEKFIQKSPDFIKEREQPPRFAPPGSFEFEFGQKWKELFQMHEEQKMNLVRVLDDGVNKLEIDQAGAMMEHQTNLLRQDLLRRQDELRRLEEMHQMELQKRMDMRRQEDDRRRGEEDRRRDDMNMRRQQQEQERRQQELYAQQERAMREMRGERGGGQAPPMQPPPAPPAGMVMGERGRQQMGPGGQGGQGQGSAGPAGKVNNLMRQQMSGHGNQGGMNEGQGGNYGNDMQGQQPPMRQSRFDQPPGFNNQGHEQGNMGPGGSMMGGGGMGRNSMGQNDRMMQERGGQRGGNAGGDRSMRDEYFEAKRARRY